MVPSARINYSTVSNFIILRSEEHCWQQLDVSLLMDLKREGGIFGLPGSASSIYYMLQTTSCNNKERQVCDHNNVQSSSLCSFSQPHMSSVHVYQTALPQCYRLVIIDERPESLHHLISLIGTISKLLLPASPQPVRAEARTSAGIAQLSSFFCRQSLGIGYDNGSSLQKELVCNKCASPSLIPSHFITKAEIRKKKTQALYLQVLQR